MLTIVGYAAIAVSAAALAPQALALHRSKGGGHVSLSMYVLFAASSAAWIAYGVVARLTALVASAAPTLAFAIYILVRTIRHRRVVKARGSGRR